MYDVTPDQPSPQLLVVSLVECIGYTVYGVLTELQTDRSGSLIRGFAFYQSLNENEKKAHRTHSILHSPSRTAPDESVRDVQSFAILRPGQPPCLYSVQSLCRRGDPQTGSLPVESNHTDHAIACYVTHYPGLDVKKTPWYVVCIGGLVYSVV